MCRRRRRRTGIPVRRFQQQPTGIDCHRAMRLVEVSALAILSLTLSDGAPYSYGCTQPGDSKRFAWCNSKLPLVNRLADLMNSVPIEVWMERMNDLPQPPFTNASLGGQCYDGPEVVHGLGGICTNVSGTLRCPTTFPSPPGMAASFNVSLWHSMGEIESVE